MTAIRILLLITISCACYLCQAQDTILDTLLAKSFTLKYTLYRNYNDRVRYEYEVDETYSSWQNRTSIRIRQTRSWSIHDFKNFKKYDDGTLYATADEEEVTRLDWDEKVCTGVDGKSHNDYFFNHDILKKFDYSPHIGLAKFLIFALLNTSEYGGGDDDFDITEIGNDAESDKFIKHVFRPSAISSFTMFYHEEDRKNLPYKIPIYVGSRITDPEGNFVLHYAVKKFEIIPNEPEYSSLDGLERPHNLGGKSVTLDQFAIKPAIGCGKFMKRVESIAEELSKIDNEHFSFKAHLTSNERAQPIEMSVGFEASIATLRQETRVGAKFSSILTNYHTGLTYELFGRNEEVSDEDRAEKDELDYDLSCTVTRALKNSEATSGKFGLGDMLFGTNDFAFLGAALVRGIETRVYESFNTTWPYWFEQPTVYHTSDDWITATKGDYIRPNKDMLDERILNTVIYVSGPTKDHQLVGSKLLRIEISILDKSTLRSLDKYNFDIYDFSWKLSGDSANGESMEQFFSLGDSCSSSEADDNHYGEIDLMLEAWMKPEITLTIFSDYEYIERTTERNFAIMRMMQETCDMPANMIYDIDSRLEKLPAPPNSGFQYIIKIQATFRVAEHTRKLVQLLYIGRGKMLGTATSKFSSFVSGNFQTCYLYAAHLKVNTVFAYDSKLTICSIFMGDTTGNTREFIEESFEISKINDDDDEGRHEVYRVLHTDKLVTKLSDALTSMKHGTFMDRVTLVNQQNQLSSIDFTLKSFQMNEIDEKNPYELDNIQFSDTNKFLGFGLVLGHKQNRAVVAPKQPDFDSDVAEFNLATDVSFGQCRAACLADLQCQSFSVCVRNAKIECIKSTVDFRAPNMVLQLMLAKDKKTKLGERLSLDIDEKEQIQVEKFPGCELHNKIHIDLFGTMELVSADVLHFSSHIVTEREQCAKLCIDKIIKVLKEDVQLSHEASYAALNNPESDMATTQRLFSELKHAHLQMCDSFFYLDKNRFHLIPGRIKEIIRKSVINNAGDGPIESYCVLGTQHSSKQAGSKSEAVDRTELGDNREIKVEQYSFDFSFMFERHQGTILEASKLDYQVGKAYSKITSHSVDKGSEHAYKVMKNFLETGANIRIWRSGTVQECARLCFTQSAPMWPGCKSFDTLESINHDLTFCFFNTISMRDALDSGRFDLIKNDHKDQDQMTYSKNYRIAHYEPKPGFIAGSLDIANQLEIAEGYIDNMHHRDGSTVSVGHFAMFLTVIVATLFGVIAGVQIGRRYLSSNEQKVEDDEKLVETRVVEFSNFVNFEGQIRDGTPDKGNQ